MTNNQNTTAFFDLIRHGEPAGGPMFRGSKDDPLSDTGWQQMNAAIRDDDQWDVIITSPLLRCRLFAEQLAEQRQIAPSASNVTSPVCCGRPCSQSMFATRAL